jgi:2-keto-3-deoxy-L-rhamnonate aldolase RhmA
MRENRIKKVIREGRLALGGYVALADPQVVEIIGLADFDAAFIDMEHTGFDLSLVGEMIRAAELAGVTSLVRVPDNDAKLILRLLDMGAEGIVVPHVDGVEGAKRAVEAVRYPPLGARGGAGSTRAARFGAIPYEEHVRDSNREVLLSVMAEDDRAISEVGRIAALDGVDLVAVGPTDLSHALGVHDPSDPRLREKVEEIAAAIRSEGKAKLALPLGHPALPLGPKDLLELGVGYANVAPSPAQTLLNAMSDRVRSIRQEAGAT